MQVLNQYANLCKYAVQLLAVPTHCRDIWAYRVFPKKHWQLNGRVWEGRPILDIAPHPVRVCQYLKSSATPDTFVQRDIPYPTPTPFSVSKVEVEPDSILYRSYLVMCRFFSFFPILVYYLYFIPENEFPFLLQELRPIKFVMHSIARRGIIRNVLNLRSVGIQCHDYNLSWGFSIHSCRPL